MSNNIGELITVVIALYTGLGFVAFKKYDKFEPIYKTIFILSLFLFVIMLSWNYAIDHFHTSLLYNSPLDFKSVDLIEVSNSIVDKSKIKLIYFILLGFSFIYVQILDFIFKPKKEIIENELDKK